MRRLAALKARDRGGRSSALPTRMLLVLCLCAAALAAGQSVSAQPPADSTGASFEVTGTIVAR